MTAPEEDAGGKFNIKMGDVHGGQVVVGDYAHVTQNVGLSPKEADELKAVFGDLRTKVAEKAPPDKREAALAETKELEGAIVTADPKPDRVRQALAWFRDNAPELAGAVAGIVINPLVGKVVEKAGKAVADQFRQIGAEQAP
jgi:hypothetical protein